MKQFHTIEQPNFFIHDMQVRKTDYMAQAHTSNMYALCICFARKPPPLAYQSRMRSIVSTTKNTRTASLVENSRRSSTIGPLSEGTYYEA